LRPVQILQACAPGKRQHREPDKYTFHRVASLACIIHEGFYYNRRYAAVTSLTAGGLAARSVNILFQVCLPPSRLRAPVSLGVSAVSSRTLVNNAG
jgi:hypothetical protein